MTSDSLFPSLVLKSYVSVLSQEKALSLRASAAAFSPYAVLVKKELVISLIFGLVGLGVHLLLSLSWLDLKAFHGKILL